MGGDITGQLSCHQTSVFAVFFLFFHLKQHLKQKLFLSDLYNFEDFLDSTNTDSEDPLLGPRSPRCSTAVKLRGG